MKKFWIIPATLVMIGVGSFYAVNKVAAVTTPISWHQNLVGRLAKAFGKTETQVQTVFNQSRTDQQAARETEYLVKLDAAVKAGTINPAQKQLLLAKHAEMIKLRPEPGFDSNQDRDQRRADMIQRRTELEAWAKQNNLPLDLLMGGFGQGSRGGMGMHKRDLVELI